MKGTGRARTLRRDATMPERALWQVLRARTLGAKVRRQVPCGPYVLDFLFWRAGLAIELDGDTHATEAGLKSDVQRDAWLNGRGIRVLRISNRDVASNLEGVLQLIAAELERRPHPNPLPHAGEGARLPARFASELGAEGTPSSSTPPLPRAGEGRGEGGAAWS